jgi:phosphoribosylformylglycinamidine synthase subunit PurQ / glutaminase
MSVASVGIVVFPGSCDEADAARAVRRTPGLEPRYMWHADADLGGVDAVIVPGGFSYGDYLRAGAIARFAPMMDQVARFAAGGGPVLGICNGFQVLCEAGLLPGALLPNTSLRFVCRQVDVLVEHTGSVFTSECAPGEALSLPVKHGFGRWYAPEDELDELERSGRLVLRYAPGHNPNGSVRDVAGVTNEQGNVLGLMPHPEHAVDELNGSADASRLFVSLAATLGALSPAAA